MGYTKKITSAMSVNWSNAIPMEFLIMILKSIRSMTPNRIWANAKSSKEVWNVSTRSLLRSPHFVTPISIFLSYQGPDKTYKWEKISEKS